MNKDLRWNRLDKIIPQKQIATFGRLATLVVKTTSWMFVFSLKSGSPLIGSIGDVGKYGSFIFWGLQAHFYSNVKNGKGQKLRRSIEIDGGLVILNFHFPKNRKVFIFMISGRMDITRNP